jgi:hypothetical protein
MMLKSRRTAAVEVIRGKGSSVPSARTQKGKEGTRSERSHREGAGRKEHSGIAATEGVIEEQGNINGSCHHLKPHSNNSRQPLPSEVYRYSGYVNPRIYIETTPSFALHVEMEHTYSVMNQKKSDDFHVVSNGVSVVFVGPSPLCTERW